MAGSGASRDEGFFSSGSTNSELSGTAGNVVQARDVSGGVHIHAEKRSPGPLPRQLPNDVRGFVNRVAELQRLDSVLDQVGSDDDGPLIMVVSGTAGVGKTSLAVRWARRTRARFPDGQLYVNLRGYDPGEPVSASDALERFLRALDVAPERVPPGEEPRAELFRSLVADRRLLIVLDNAASVAQVRPLLPGSPSCQVLITSRSRLSGLVARDGARRINVDILSAVEAVRLLRETTADYRDGDSDNDLAELSRLCAYLPLALRIAAERAAARPRMPLQELISDLRDESALWDALSTDDEGEGDAVRTVFAWSYRALPEGAARLFRRLGLHPGPEFGLHAAAALASESPGVTRRLLDALVGAHLLEEIGPSRYQFHDLLRAYAADQAHSIDAEQDRRISIGRLFQFYLHASVTLVRAVGAEFTMPASVAAPDPSIHLPSFNDSPAAMDWYAVERRNLILVAKAAVDGGMGRVGWQIPAVLREVRFHVDPPNTWSDVHERGLEFARRDGDPSGQAFMLECLAIDARLSGRLSVAKALYGQAAELFDQAGNKFGSMLAVNGLGLVCHRVRDLDGADSSFSKALAAAQDLDDSLYMAIVRLNLGEVWLDLGEVEQAVTMLQESVTRLSTLGERWYWLGACQMLGRALWAAGRLSEARRVLEDAMAHAGEYTTPVMQAHLNLELARLLLTESRPEEALEASQSAATTFRHLENRDFEGTAWSLAGQSFLSLKRFDEAAAFLQMAANAHKSVDNLWLAANDLHSLASVLSAMDDHERAQQHLNEARGLLESFSDPVANRLKARIDADLEGHRD